MEYRTALAHQWGLQATIQSALSNSSQALVLSQRCIKFHEELLGAHPEIDVAPLLELGQGYYNLGDAQRSSGKGPDSRTSFEKATRRLEQYLEKTPKNWLARLLHARATYSLGVVVYEGGNAVEGRNAMRKGLERFQACIDENPNLSAAHIDLAGKLHFCPALDLRDPARAALHAKKGTELAPQDAVAWLNLGCARYRLRDWKGALEALQESNRLNSRVVTPFWLAMSYWQLGQQDEARKQYVEGVSRLERSRNRSASVAAIRAEAGQLLGIADRASAAKDKPPETKPQAKTESNQPPPSKGQADRHPPKADKVVKPTPKEEDSQKRRASSSSPHSSR